MVVIATLPFFLSADAGSSNTSSMQSLVFIVGWTAILGGWGSRLILNRLRRQSDAVPGNRAFPMLAGCTLVVAIGLGMMCLGHAPSRMLVPIGTAFALTVAYLRLRRVFRADRSTGRQQRSKGA